MADRDSYGSHLTMRIAEVERRAALADPAAVTAFLRALVGELGMSILAGPLVETEWGGPERFGVSGVVILYESHAAVHTYPEVGQAFLDVFSCRPFDPAVVLGVLTGFFGGHHIVEQELRTRGVHWGTDVDSELRAWGRTR